MALSSRPTFKKSKNRSNKINLVFDEDKRREFLTGFHKRKLQRKKKAQEKLESELKEERKRLKHEAKESYKKLVRSNRPIPELEHLLQEEYEDEDVTVKITELSTSDMAKQNNWIGPNAPKYNEQEDETSDESDDETEEVPGMELKVRKQKKPHVDSKVFSSTKEIKKELKMTATKNVKSSTVFQKKNKLERQKQKKKALQKKKEKNRMNKKYMKKKGNKQKQHNKI